MFPASIIQSLQDLDTAISAAEKSNTPGTGGTPVPDGSVVVTADDVDNLNADLASKTARVLAIGKAPAPATTDGSTSGQ